jgi:hypothetical protein
MTLNPFKIYRNYKKIKADIIINTFILYAIPQMDAVKLNIIISQNAKTKQEKINKQFELAQQIIDNALSISKAYDVIKTVFEITKSYYMTLKLSELASRLNMDVIRLQKL